jgi:hypothetical protein
MHALSRATRPASFRQAGPRRILGPALSLAPDQPSNIVSAALTPHGALSAVRCRTWAPMLFQAPAARSQGNAYLRLRIKAKAQKREDGADVGRCTAVIRPLTIYGEALLSSGKYGDQSETYLTSVQLKRRGPSRPPGPYHFFLHPVTLLRQAVAITRLARHL